MASSPNPLVWDYSYRADDSTGLGGVVHYYDEQAQTLYTESDGFHTTYGDIPDGHWKQNPLSKYKRINRSSYSKLRLDHAMNGTINLIGIDNGSLVYMRYAYAMDISSLLDSWSWGSQIDSPIQEFEGDVMNIGPLVYSDDLTLFQPGSRIRVGVRVGESDLYLIGQAWLDEANLAVDEAIISMSGRNTVGYWLRSQTVDNDYDKFTKSTVREIIIAMLDMGGVENYQVQSNPSTSIVGSFEFAPSDTLLDCINECMSYVTDEEYKMKMVELEDGTIMVGFENWLEAKYSNGYYVFDDTAEVFSRGTTKTVDGSYTQLRATGDKIVVDADGNEEEVPLTPVIVPIENFKYWGLGPRRTVHEKYPGFGSQSELAKWAKARALAYQYIGIGEDFTGPFRPQMIVGDVATAKEGSVGTDLGLITEVRHVFSRSGGYITEFAVDSGGVKFDGSNYVVYSRAAEVHGVNRRQRIVDLVRIVAGR